MGARTARTVLLIANSVATALLVFDLYSMIAAAGIAAEIVMWPFYTLLSISLVLSVVGLAVTRGTVPRDARDMGRLVNGCALAFDLLILAGISALFLLTTRERFLIPDGYKGDVYVIYCIPNGEPLDRKRRDVTYHIPEDGVLPVRDGMLSEWTKPEYDYELKGGKLKPITNLWASTIDPTPENTSNDRDIGVFFPRSGSFENSAGCSVVYQQFYVGTKAHLITKYKPFEISDYLNEHPQLCGNRK